MKSEHTRQVEEYLSAINYIKMNNNKSEMDLKDQIKIMTIKSHKYK